MIPPDPAQWLLGTLRSTGWLAITIVFLLCGWTQWWALGPFAAGLALATLLLVSLATAVPRIIRPPSDEKNRQGPAPKTAILGFALVKYPMVATIIWWIVRTWEMRAVVAFAGGFVCLQLVIAARAIGKAWSESEPTIRRSRLAADD